MVRVFFLFVGLAGCAGGGGQTSSDVDYATLYQSIVNVGVTPFSQVPDSGDHRYTGQMVLDLPFGAIPREDYVGSFNVTFAVDGTSVGASGQVSGFSNMSGDDLGGALAFGGGMMFPDADPARDFLLMADLDGNLIKNGVTYDVSAKIQGDFYGQEADGLAGLVYAGAIRQGDDVDVFDGSFAGNAAP